MGRRHPDYRRIKLHRTYTIAELAGQFDVHANTIRNWRSEGLEAVDDRRPALFHGSTIRAFLIGRRENSKSPTGPGRMYCLPCRGPKTPAGRMADYRSETATGGKLEGLCPDCSRLIVRYVSRAQLPTITAGLDVQFPHA